MSAVTIVPLEAGAKLSKSKLIADLMTWSNIEEEPEISIEDGTMSFALGQFYVGISLIKGPVPEDVLEAALLMAWMWPDAATEMAKQRGHLLMQVKDVPGEFGPVFERMLSTEVTASVLASTDKAIGVFVPESDVIVESGLYLGMAKELLPEEFAVPLWVNCCVGPTEDDSSLSYGFTQGLESMGHMDLVADNANESPKELRQRLLNLADVLVTNGPILEDGITIEDEEGLEITFRYADSPYNHEGQVIWLDY